MEGQRDQIIGKGEGDRGTVVETVARDATRGGLKVKYCYSINGLRPPKLLWHLHITHFDVA